jgi:nucleoside-diphosphate-sugar epimerase
MMYMPDAIRAAIDLMEADPTKLKHRNSFNITAMSFDPEIIYAEIKKHIPDFTMTYQVDHVKQAIADSWPNKMDDSCARAEWGWKPEWDLPAMTRDMLRVIGEKHAKGLI